jgi:hypothetical protein
MSVLNGDPSYRYPGNLNYSFAYVEGESLLMVHLSLSFLHSLYSLVTQEHCGVLWFSLHFCLSRAFLCSPRHWCG